MPIGDFVNSIPPLGFLVVHIALFGAGTYFAWRSFGAGASTLGWGFALFALAEIVYMRELGLLGGAFSLFGAAELVYMTYHLDWTVFLFAHTIAEVLNLVAFTLLFVGASRSILGRSGDPARA